LFNIGSGPTSWKNKLQDGVAQWKILKQNIMPLQSYKKIIMVVSFVGRDGLSTFEIDDKVA
jgi:hypothetical protein